ncbi:LysR substrate-binding domain-containing protein [Mesorhizobium sp. dw_380]|uniref:LysR substrate-binding domain-containing protein n=1 Tax=Mesorhizobium sp. dw_380 TaxID=2812001 RepID=UPI003330C4B6
MCRCRWRGDHACWAGGRAAAGVGARGGRSGALGRRVGAGAGLSLGPRLAGGDALGRGGLVELAGPGRAQAAPLAMVWRRRRVQPPALRQLLAAARDTPAS